MKFRHNLAVVIGINKYQHGVPILKTPVNDAQTLAKTLQTQHGYRILLLLNQQANRSTLTKLLEEALPKQVDVDDRVLFYFAGHGIALNGEDGPEGYLIPQDARLGDVSTYLPMSQVHNALHELPCRHFLGILDCCFAGAFRWSGTRKLMLVESETLHQERFDRFIQDRAWQVITSAAYDQTALDSFDLNHERGQVGKHSPFAAALIEALQGKADVYPPAAPGKPAGDGVITATELYLYLRDRIEPATEARAIRQTPGIHPLKKHDKGEYIFLAPGHPLNLPPAPPLDASNNPYRGLEAFEEEHQDLFFGRKVLIQELYEFFQQQALTVVLGASGSGKSSLVKAGLIPQLRQNSDETSWCILPPFRPGESPLKALNNTLATANLVTLPPTDESTNSPSLTDCLAAWFESHPCDRVVLIVDQLEELITLCPNQAEQEQFLEILAHAVLTYPQHFCLLLTLRSDFEPQFRNTPLESYWQSGRFVVPAMSREALREAIEEPASARVIFFEPHTLVDQLIDEVANMPGALPLLSFALSELYLKYLQRQDKAKRQDNTIDRSITQADYDELGGVTRSLTQRADQEYTSLVNQDSAYAQTIRNVMLRMVAVGGELARRRVPEFELHYPEPENRRVENVIQQFLAARLIVAGTDANHQTYFEPAHDALVRGWDKLLMWQKEQEETLILQRRLTPAATEWESIRSKTHEQTKKGLNKADAALNWLDRRLFTVENLVNQWTARVVRLVQRSQRQQEGSGENPNQFLWNANPYLDVLNQKLSTRDTWLNQLESEFVQQSVLQKRRNISWRWRITTSIILILSALLIWALSEQRKTVIGQISTLRESTESDLRSNYFTLDALLNSLRAAKLTKHWLLRLQPPEEALRNQVIGTLRKAFYLVKEENRWALPQDWEIQDIFVGSDGKPVLAITKNESKVLCIWSLERLLCDENYRIFLKSPDVPYGIEFSPDGRTLAVTSKVNDDKTTVRLWDWANERFFELPGHIKGWFTSFSFSPNGREVAILDKSTPSVWNLENNQWYLLPGNPTNVKGIQFDSNGNLLLAVSAKPGQEGSVDHTLELWQSDRGQYKVLGKTAVPREVDKAIISPNGERVVIIYGSAANYGAGSLLWIVANMIDGNKLEQLDQDIVMGFGKTNKYLATSDSKGSISLRNFVSQETMELNGQQGSLSGMEFSQDESSKFLITAGNDGTIRLWGMEWQLLSSVGDSQRFTVSTNKWVYIEDNKCNLDGVPENLLSKLIGINIHADESIRNTIDIRNCLSNKLFASIRIHPDYLRYLSAIDVNSDAGLIAVARSDKTVGLWDFQGSQLVEFKASSDNVKSLSISADGNMLAIKSGSTIQRWQIGGLDELLSKGCDRVREYLSHPNSNLSESDRRLCDGIN